jgi:hypothetical protein
MDEMDLNGTFKIRGGDEKWTKTICWKIMKETTCETSA